jgi:hypothetical protein
VFRSRCTGAMRGDDLANGFAHRMSRRRQWDAIRSMAVMLARECKAWTTLYRIAGNIDSDRSRIVDGWRYQWTIHAA